jgi:HK97 family phage portal protein
MPDWFAPFRPRRAAAPEAKTAPALSLHDLPQPVWTPRDYGALAREGFARNPVVHRCVRMIAEAAAGIPLAVTVDGAPAPDHPLARLLAAPNPDQTGHELMEAFHGYLQVAGNAYLLATTLGEAPGALHALRPDRTRVIPGPRGWPVGWVHGPPGAGGSTFLRDPATGGSPVLHLKLFHPADDHYGLSPLEAAAAAVDIHNAGGAWNKALIDNAARPSGALVFQGRDGTDRLTGEQFDRLKAELERVHTGPSGAGRPLLLEGGLDWKPMSLTPADMDFQEARNGAAREIALAFGVPPMLLGIPGDNTYANYREANLAFWRQTVLPLVAKTARALTVWLGARYPDRPDIAPDLEAAPALQSEREALWSRLETASFLTVAEKRRAAGLPAEGGPS